MKKIPYVGQRVLFRGNYRDDLEIGVVQSFTRTGQGLQASILGVAGVVMLCYVVDLKQLPKGQL